MVKTVTVLYVYTVLQVQDLLHPGKDLAIREDTDKNIIVCGLMEKVVDSVEGFNQTFGPASKNRLVYTKIMGM